MHKHVKCLLTMIVFLSCSAIDSFGQKVFISGFVEDGSSGERLIGASIYNPKTYKGQTTNEYGFLGISVDGLPAVLNVSYLGYNAKEIRIDHKTDSLLIIPLSKKTVELEEIQVTAKNNSLKTPLLGMNNISMKELATSMFTKDVSLHPLSIAQAVREGIRCGLVAIIFCHEDT